MTSIDWFGYIYDWARNALKARGGEATAAELLSAYVRQRPSDRAAVFLLGDVLRELGRFNDAEKLLKRALALAIPEQVVQVEAALGMLFEARGAPRRAESWFRRATENAHGATKGWIWIVRGCNLIALGALEDSARCQQLAASLTGDPDEAYLNLGFVRRAQRRYEEAIQAFEIALVISPTYPEAVGALSGLHDIFAALELGNSLARTTPTLGDDLDRARDWARKAFGSRTGAALAAELLIRYVERRPRDSYATFMLGDALRAVGRFRESGPMLLHSLASAPAKGRALVMTSLGRLMALSGKLGRAEGWFRRAAEDVYGAANGAVWRLRGDNLVRAERYEASAVCLERAVQLAPDDPRGYMSLGVLRRAQRRYCEAIAAFERAAALSPQTDEASVAHNGLLDVFHAMEEVGAHAMRGAADEGK